MRFIGKNFVFDERMGERISNDVIAHCHQCAPCDTHTNCLNDGCHLLFIQCPSCAEKFAGCCSEACMEEHKLPEEEQRKLRAGRENGNKIFNKSRGRLNTKLGILDPEPSENHNQTRSMIASSSQSAVDHKCSRTLLTSILNRRCITALNH